MTRSIPFALALAFPFAASAAADTVQIRLVSHAYANPNASRNAEYPAISANGRHVAFVSPANDLTAQPDTNLYSDVFVKDLACGSVERVSDAWNGAQATKSTYEGPSISGDGRYVAFASWADLMPDDPNLGRPDVFLFDRSTRMLRRIGPPAALPASDVEYNKNAYSGSPSVSADGRFVAFHSNYRGLVAGPSNTSAQVYLYEIATGTFVRLSNRVDGGLPSGSNLYPRISADGNRVVFLSSSSDLIPNPVRGSPHAYVYDRTTGTSDLVDRAPGALPPNGATVGSNGRPKPESEPQMAISADGRYVAFSSNATDLLPEVGNASQWNVFVRDTWTQTLTAVRLNDINHWGRMPALDASGRKLVYTSQNMDYQSGDAFTGLYRRDLDGGASSLLTSGYNPGGRAIPENGQSQRASSSADGLRVAFDSWSSNLLPGITSGGVYVADITPGEGPGSLPSTCVR